MVLASPLLLSRDLNPMTQPLLYLSLFERSLLNLVTKSARYVVCSNSSSCTRRGGCYNRRRGGDDDEMRGGSIIGGWDDGRSG